jgi:HSP20 family molecular chaperone IbpA
LQLRRFKGAGSLRLPLTNWKQWPTGFDAGRTKFFRIAGPTAGTSLQAEHDPIFVPESELVEKDGKYKIRVAAPGFKATETSVTALPDAVIVSAESSHKPEETQPDIFEI